jgi:hypothetical protein
MSKIGIIRDSISVNKPVKIEYINKIETTVNKIQIFYSTGNFNNAATVVILLVNPDVSSYTAAYIRERVLRWISDGLSSTSALVLNEYLGKIVPTQVGVIGTQTTGQIISAVDSATACVASPNITVAIDANNAAPLIGTGIYIIDGGTGSGFPGIPTEPVAAGNYALLLGLTQYFITVNSVSNISFVEVCPLALDYVFNLQNLGAGPVTNADLDGISFSLRSFFINNYFGYVGYTGNPNSEPPEFQGCDSAFNESVYGSNNAMWPIGDINNAGKDFSAFDVSFAISLSDSNVANFQDANFYISFDLNANAGVVADATFVPFQIGFGTSPIFAESPTTGIPGLGDGTVFVTPTQTQNRFRDLLSGEVFVPAVGQSLIGNANFTNGSWLNVNLFTGQVSFVNNTTCNP